MSRFTVLQLMSSAAKSQGHICLIVTVLYYAFILVSCPSLVLETCHYSINFGKYLEVAMKVTK